MMTEKSAGFILITDDFETDDYSVLLLHYTSGHWDFPKGNIETNENELQAATRELQEETGIETFRVIPNFRYVLNYKYIRKTMVISKRVTLFLASTGVRKVKISHEHIGYSWVKKSDATTQLTYKNAKNALTQAINFLETPSSNIQ
ncbi:MAG TPA: NUDIX domain-containing protein [Nitrososphaeraceae archaeon]|nr:NUDIX domain-containing protein [Nitrososphaeraceae archaeon]